MMVDAVTYKSIPDTMGPVLSTEASLFQRFIYIVLGPDLKKVSIID